MRCITRYVLTEFLKLFLVTLSCMTLVMVVAVVAKEAIRQGLGPSAVFRLIPYALPVALLYAVPGTTLFSACSVFGRMAAANEVTAIKSLGVSPLSVLWPAVLFASFVSVGAVWLNDFAVSWGRVGLKRVVLESAEQIAYGMLKSSRSYSRNGVSIHVKNVEGPRLIRPTLTVYESADAPAITLTAEEAELHTDADSESLLVSLTNGLIERGDDLKMEFHDTEVIEIPLTSGAHEARGFGRPSDTPLRHIPDAIDTQRVTIERLERSLAAEAAYQLMTGDFAGLLHQRWMGKHASLAAAKSTLFRLHTEPWRRWANGFSCLAFVMVGAPLAIRLRNADVWTSFILCFLPILIVYYPLLAYGVDRAKAGSLPPYGVWIGNLVLFAVGYWQTRKVLRY